MQSGRSSSENPAQDGERPSRSRREEAEPWKDLWQRLDRLDRKVSRVDHRTRTIVRGYRPLLEFSEAFILEIVCRDAVDEAILDILVQAGRDGRLPSQISELLEERGFRGVNRWQVTRRIQAMNNRLRREVEERAAEKRGHRWALTSFMRDAWHATLEEAKGERSTP